MMMDEAEVTTQVSPEMEQRAVQIAREKARSARWDLDVAVFFFAVLVIVTILLFQEVRIEIVAPVAAVGLAMGWLMGWKKGRQAYQRIHDEELSKLIQDSQRVVEEADGETIEEKIQKALRDWRR